MFLKRLDVVGFKSFAERISIDFVEGVTAVVGPNGSGKSNVTDAIRWVLGEQSAKSLRGTKMEDIIFAGSDSRKPLNFAEVTLTLDNEDQVLPIEYNEINVTRRVYRSGDSEFFINKQPCRLKDIVDLFMDSGLGREAFSIIGQGKVEEILNSKPEERRAIFEEAAGVLKYKTRKKKAEQKLVETQENLNRVHDILHELENQVEPLQIQASIAKDFLEKKEELETFEVACIVYEIEQLHEQWEQLKKNHAEHQEQELALAAEVQTKEANLTQKRDHLAALDESISDLQNVLLSASEELEKLEGRKEVLKERKKNASQNRGQLEENIKEMEYKLQELNVQIDNLHKQTEQSRKEAEQLKSDLQSKQSIMKSLSDNLEEKIESLKSDYIDKLNLQASSKNELNYLDQQMQQLKMKNDRLVQGNEKHIAERNTLERERKAVEQAFEQSQSKLAEHVSNYRRARSELEALKAKYAKQESNLYQAYQILQQAKSRKEMLEALEEDFAGFFQGVKEVLKARGEKLSGIEGAVAELITVPKMYEAAIETALGAAMQHIVTSDEPSARKAIAYLKEHRFGRATFLPLTVIKGKTLPASIVSGLEGDERFLGAAARVISFDDKYANVITSLLGNVLIAKDLKGANEIAKQLGYRYRIVTLDGDIVNPGGAMTGGAVKQKNTSVLSRKSELEDLKEKIAMMEKKTLAFENQVKQLKEEIAGREKKAEDFESIAEKLRLEEQELKDRLRELEFSYKNLNDRLSLYDMEKREFEGETVRIDSRKTELQKTLQQIGDEIHSLEQEIQELTERKQEDRTLRDSLVTEISDLKALLAVKNEQVTSGNKQLEALQTEADQSKKKLKQWKEDLQWLHSEMAESGQGEEQLEEAARQKLMDKQETTKLISLRREERMGLQQLLEDGEAELKEIKRLHKGMLEVVQDEEIKINRLDVELENRLDQLRKEYTLSFEAAKEQHPLTIPIEDARKKVKLIKLAIEELGNVNIGAIEEYERVSERHSFLLAQKTDLQEAKDTLVQVIEEMDEEMIKRFKTTFQAIRDQFGTVFHSLFGGGRAELKLTDPANMLTTGVEIVAQPPGKKLQNLGLLSGGERALTAIALLFSILKVRPVPFCVLDEVEAALDEANVSRFSQYLKQFSRETQFIVITHRKGTMEEADVLYGITMQESGVSKLVSVRLEETKQLIEA